MERSEWLVEPTGGREQDSGPRTGPDSTAPEDWLPADLKPPKKVEDAVDQPSSHVVEFLERSSRVEARVEAIERQVKIARERVAALTARMAAELERERSALPAQSVSRS